MMAEADEVPVDRLNELLNQASASGEQSRADPTISSAVNYDWKSKPKLINHCSSELATNANNYLKGCKWSPDGSCLLTNSRDHCLRLFNLPQNLCQNPIILDEESEELVKDLSIFSANKETNDDYLRRI